MSLTESDSRPAGNGPATKSLGSTADSTGTADNDLWSLAERCPADQLFALSVGYRLGLLERHGYRAGYADAERAMAARWHKVFVQVQATAKRPTFAELQRRRGEVA